MPKVTEVEELVNRLLEQIERSSNQAAQSDARRASFRYVWPGHATVQPLDPDDSSEPLLVTVAHITRDSLDFRSPRRFQIDQKVLITLETDQGQLQIPATVVHTTESVVKFIIGVKFNLHDSGQTEDDNGQTDDDSGQDDDRQ